MIKYLLPENELIDFYKKFNSDKDFINQYIGKREILIGSKEALLFIKKIKEQLIKEF